MTWWRLFCHGKITLQNLKELVDFLKEQRKKIVNAILGNCGFVLCVADDKAGYVDSRHMLEVLKVILLKEQ